MVSPQSVEHVNTISSADQSTHQRNRKAIDTIADQEQSSNDWVSMFGLEVLIVQSKMLTHRHYNNRYYYTITKG